MRLLDWQELPITTPCMPSDCSNTSTSISFLSYLNFRLRQKYINMPDLDCAGRDFAASSPVRGLDCLDGLDCDFLSLIMTVLRSRATWPTYFHIGISLLSRNKFTSTWTAASIHADRISSSLSGGLVLWLVLMVCLIG